MRITAAAPAALVSDANAFAMCLAFSEADGATYRGLNWQDSAGNLYACASWEARDEWVQGASQPLQRPAWDVEPYKVNMTAAATAQAALVFSLEPIAADPAKLTAIGGMSGPDALAAMGLTPVEAL